MPSISGAEFKKVRPVNPSLENISGWISSVPSTQMRYQPFTLSAQPYDENTMAPMGCLPLNWN